MRKLLTLFLFALFIVNYSTTWAQTSFNISGKVQEKGKTEFLPGATIILTKPKATTGRGVVTTDRGTFVIKGVKPGSYVLQVSFIGYNSLKQNIRVIDQNINVGTLQLQVSSQRLKEIQIIV